MIGRIWRTRVEPRRAAEYEAFARERSLAMFRCQPGFAGVVMLRHDQDCIVLTLWRDQADIDALAQSSSYQETVRAILDRGFLHGEQSVERFDVHLLALEPLAVDFAQ